MNTEILAYLAGAMDSDGCFTYHRQKNSIEETIMLNQVTDEITDLLRSSFEGNVYYYASKMENRRPLYRYVLRGPRVGPVCESLIPYLRIKKRQAELLVEFSTTRARYYRQPAYWFAQEYPDWRNLEMLTTKQVCDMMGYSSIVAVGNAVGGGILLALPGKGKNSSVPRIPRIMVELLSKDNQSRQPTNPTQLIAWRERIVLQLRRLNHTGLAEFDEAG